MATIISVVSGKGGTGKTTVSGMLAASLAKYKQKVLAVDLDVGLRSLDMVMGLENKVVFDLGDVLDGKCNLQNAIVEYEAVEDLHLICSPAEVNENFSMKKILSMIRELSDAYDYVILDLPAGLGISILVARELADVNLVVTVPESTTLRDTKKICDSIAQHADSGCNLVINRVSKTAMEICDAEDLDEIVDRIGIPLLAVIPENPYILAPPKRATDLSASTVKIFHAMARRMMGTYVPIILRKL